MSTLDELNSKYALCDGAICSINLQYADFVNEVYIDPAVELIVEVRKEVAKKLVPVRLVLEFQQLLEVSIFDNTLRDNIFSDFKFFETTEGYYLSFDPYDNTQCIHDNDNGIIRAKFFQYRELEI